MRDKGRIFVISGPSGAGKSTVVDEVLKSCGDSAARVITCTTRQPRGKELADSDYIFLTLETFKQKEASGEFLESANVFGHYYGTLYKTVREIEEKGKDVLLVIDVQGALEVMKKLKVISIFIKPPSMEELERRITGRATDRADAIKLRLAKAQQEMDASQYYDYIVVNDDLETACKAVREIMNIGVEKHA